MEKVLKKGFSLLGIYIIFSISIVIYIDIVKERVIVIVIT